MSTDSIWHQDISQQSRLASTLECHHRLADVGVSIGDNLVDEACMRVLLHDVDKHAAVTLEGMDECAQPLCSTMST